MKRYRNKILVGIMFLVFGIIFVSFSAVDVVREYDTYNNRVRVEGYVENVNYRTKTTLISFTTLEGITVQKEFNMIDTSMNKGDTIAVYYHKDNYNQSFIKTQILYVMGFFTVGLILIFIFLIVFIIVIVSVLNDIKLMKNGKRIDAKIESITINRTMTRCPYKVVLSYTEGKKTYKFKYNSVWFNIKDLVDVYKIKTIPVYVTKDYKKYYIDFTTLETLND
jgi:TM2 domain-containing membrane protein YozV